MAYLSPEEVEAIGFAQVGHDVFISDKASFHNAGKISLGSFVRIDDFCLLSAGDGGIEIGDYVHISCYACLIGKGLIKLNDYVLISIKATILSSNSDFSGQFAPALKEFDTLDKSFATVFCEAVIFETHTGLGAHSVVLPGVTVGEGTAIGAQSVVYQNLNPWGIYVGNPARFVKKRSKHVYEILQGLKGSSEEEPQVL